MTLARAATSGIDEILPLLLDAVDRRHRGDWQGALACLDDALRVDPRFLPLQVERGLVLAQLGRYEEAVVAVDSFLRYAPPLPEIEALRDEIVEQGFAALDARLHAQPDDPQARLCRAGLLCLCDRHGQAVHDYQALLQRTPDHVDALNGLGSAWLALDRHDDAVAAYACATSLAPERAEISYNLGNVLQQQGRFADARLAYRRAIERVPDFAEAHLEIAHCWLAQGNAHGWAELEWRWQSAQLRGARLASAQPLWLGRSFSPLPGKLAPVTAAADLSTKTLLVWAEQGLGDTLQFIRFVVRLPAHAARVIVRVQQTLVRLLAAIDPRVEVIGDDAALPAHDAQCPLLSLPLALAIDDINATAAAPYVHADADEVAQWRALLGETRRLRVGLAWAGRQFGVRNRTRDLPLAALLPLAGVDVELVSLQKEIPAADAATLASLPELRQFAAAELPDFAATAALIANLDLVVSADTAVAHLAAALGRPCWLLLRYSSEWRWQRERSDSPWYPTLRIFRQPRAGDWASAVAALGGELAALAAARAAA